MAVERFGKVEGLAIIRLNTLKLAEHYAERYQLDMADPEVAVIASALAFTRHKQLILLSEVEEDLFRRSLGSADAQDYGRTLFKVTQAGTHREIHREIDRLHSRARAYSKELRYLADDASRGSGD